jgi:hypothetical protein
MLIKYFKIFQPAENYLIGCVDGWIDEKMDGWMDHG